MIINSLNIYGFGKLTDVTISLNNGINIIEGKNEAGKSTIMAFIRAMLFGFAGRRSLHERYEPLHGGKFGGSVDLIDSKQEIYRVERIYQQKVSGDVKITLPSGEIVSEEYLPYLLGRINENVFKQIFCFGLTELQQIDLFQGNQINDFIYHAGTGSVNQILKMKHDLESKKKLLFLKGGNKPEINELISNLDIVTNSIDTIKQKNKQHQSYLQQIILLEQDIINFEEKVKKDEMDLTWFQLLERSYEPYHRIKEIDILLKDFPSEFNFPENGVERLENTLTKINELKIERQQLSDKMEEIKNGIIVMENASFYEENINTINNLKEQLNLYLNQTKSEQLLDIELKEVLTSIEDELKQIGSEYTEEKIRSIEFTLQSRQYIQELATKIEEKQKQLTEVDKEIELTNKNLIRIQNVLQDRSNEQKTAQNSEQIKDIYPLINKYWARLRECEWQQTKILEQKDDYNKQFKAIKTNNFSLVSLLTINGVAIIASIALIIFFNTWLYGGLLFGASLFFSLLFQISSSKINDKYKKSIRNNTKDLDNQLQQVEYEIRQIKGKSRELLASIGFEDLNEITFQKIEDLRIADLQKEQHQHGEENRIKEYQQEFKQYKTELELLEIKKNNLLVEYTELIQLWQGWMLKHNIAPDTTMSILNNLITIIQKIKELYNVRDKLLAQKDAIISSKEQYENQVNALYEINIADNNSSNITIADKVNYLIEQLKRVEQLKVTNTHNSERIEEFDDRINKINKLIEAEEQNYNELLEYGNTTDKEEFYKLEKRYEQFKLYTEEKQRQLSIIQNNCHNDTKYDKMLEDLNIFNKEEIIIKLDQLNADIKGTSERIKSSSEQKGEIQNKVKEIEEDSTLSVLNQDYSRISTELTKKVKEWTALSLSKHILEKTMKSYEEEKQPLILQGASKYFSQMTSNEYVKVIASLGTNEIRVLRKDGIYFEPQYLSRGTVEQLFLAIRYALVEEYSKQKRLPLILDDIFVNFDSQRLINSLTTLKYLSDNHQIIIFTCHTQILTKIKFIVDEVNYVALS
ncbi:MAG: AAA family ATPase [Vulcanibacillus sp.]